jgi:hypothetical protein
MLPPGLRQLLKNLHGHGIVAVYWRRNAPHRPTFPIVGTGEARREEDASHSAIFAKSSAPISRLGLGLASVESLRMQEMQLAT